MRTSASTGTLLAAASALGGVAALFVLRRARRRADAPDGPDPDHAAVVSPEDTLRLIRHRRSIFPKQYTGGAVPDEVVSDMLEAARWAPTHKLTEPWRFVVLKTDQAREGLGSFLAEQYRESQLATGKEVVPAKFEKKKKNAALASHVIAIVVDSGGKGQKASNPFIEEVASVSMAVQNMYLVAAAHGVGVYWSSGAVHAKGGSVSKYSRGDTFLSQFNAEMRTFVGLEESQQCLGWLFVGEFDTSKKWPKGSRKPLDSRVHWR